MVWLLGFLLPHYYISRIHHHNKETHIVPKPGARVAASFQTAVLFVPVCRMRSAVMLNLIRGVAVKKALVVRALFAALLLPMAGTALAATDTVTTLADS